MSNEGRTAREGGMNEADGCEVERWHGWLRAAAQVWSDGGSFSLKGCHAAFSDDVEFAHRDWHCPHLQHQSHWHLSGRWGRTRGRGTRMG